MSKNSRELPLMCLTWLSLSAESFVKNVWAPKLWVTQKFLMTHFEAVFTKKWYLMFKRPVWPQVFSCTELQTMRILNPQVFIVDYLSYSKWTSVFEFMWLLLFMLSSYATMHTQICLIADMLFFFLTWK